MNTQAPLPLDRDPTGTVKVHSIFDTIQGEGPFAGHAATFIRLYGCNLQCPGCDTEYTSNFTPFSISELTLALAVRLLPLRHLLVITGGEPFRQNISPLVWALIESSWHFRVQVETNGVLYPGDGFPWGHPSVTVVCSPKTGRIHPQTAQMVNAYKYVLAWDGVAPDGLPNSALAHPLAGFTTVARPPKGWEGPIYLNPFDDQQEPDNNSANLQACVNSVLKHRRYILGVQMHKLVQLP